MIFLEEKFYTFSKASMLLLSTGGQAFRSTALGWKQIQRQAKGRKDGFSGFRF
jgi:hypothetical protein